MTPADRAKISVEAPKETALQKFLQRRNTSTGSSLPLVQSSKEKSDLACLLGKMFLTRGSTFTICSPLSPWILSGMFLTEFVNSLVFIDLPHSAS